LEALSKKEISTKIRVEAKADTTSKVNPTSKVTVRERTVRVVTSIEVRADPTMIGTKTEARVKTLPNGDRTKTRWWSHCERPPRNTC